MNTRLLNKIKRIFQAEPRRLEMRDFLAFASGLDGPACETIGCIAGWAALLNRWKGNQPFKSAAAEAMSLEGEIGSLAVQGQQALRLTDGQANRLFYPDNWPKDLWSEYNKARSAKGRVAATIKRINLFIRTRGKV